MFSDKRGYLSRSITIQDRDHGTLHISVYGVSRSGILSINPSNHCSPHPKNQPTWIRSISKLMSMYLWVGFCLSFWGMQCSLHKISQPTYPPYISNPLPSWRISEFQHGFNLIRVHCFLWCHFHFCLGLGSICLFFFRFRGPQRMLKTPQNEVFYADLEMFSHLTISLESDIQVYRTGNKSIMICCEKNPPPFRGRETFPHWSMFLFDSIMV